MHNPSPSSGRHAWRWVTIGAVLLATTATFAWAAGWLAPGRLEPSDFVNQLQKDGGIHPGYRRNHAKGICVAGYFRSSGKAHGYSVAQVFDAGMRTPVVGRFAVPGPNPRVSDASVPIRSMALRFTLSNGQQWRTGMNAMPVFPVATPQAFYALLQAQQPDPNTGKPDPARIKAFFATHPEAAPFLAWAHHAHASASYASLRYNSIDAFYFVDAAGHRHAVRWAMVPADSASIGDGSERTVAPNGLASDLEQRLAKGPLRWRLVVQFAAAGDAIDDPSRVWPADRPSVDAGTLVLDRVEPQRSGPCRDVNYDPTVLPDGIEISGDPFLPARSAVYADSYLRRTSEEAHLPGFPRPHHAAPTPAAAAATETRP